VLEYCFGRALDLAGKADVAEEFYREAMSRCEFDNWSVTLAGAELCKRHSTSTPDEEEPDDSL